MAVAGVRSSVPQDSWSHVFVVGYVGSEVVGVVSFGLGDGVEGLFYEFGVVVVLVGLGYEGVDGRGGGVEWAP